MALASFIAKVLQAVGQGQYSVDGSGGKDPSVDTVLLATHSGSATTHSASLATHKTSLGTHSGSATTHSASLATHAASLVTDVGTVSGADETAVEAAVATLEGDGASPTQAHVTALRGVWNTMKTDVALVVTDKTNVNADSTNLTADAAALATDNTNVGTDSTNLTADAAAIATDSTNLTADVGANVTLTFNTAVVTTMNQLKSALKVLVRQVEASGKLTP